MSPEHLLPVERSGGACKLLVKDDDILELDVGTSPWERTVEDLLGSGIVLIDKPKNPTSHQVSAWVRDMLGLEKAGHFGTLDPAVTGVLPVALERAARLADVMLGAGKEYVGIIHLHRKVPEGDVRSMLREFTGEIYQFPPVKSAVKRQLRARTIYYLEMLELDGRDVLVKVGCQGGTYIRTLAVDVGDALGVGGHLRELRRTKVGLMHEDECVNLHALKDAWLAYGEEGDEGPIRKMVRPMESILSDMPRIVLKDTAVDAICHGADVGVNGINRLEEGIRPGDRARLLTRKEALVAIGEAKLSTEAVMSAEKGIAVRTDKVLMDPGTYPPMWKKGGKR